MPLSNKPNYMQKLLFSLAFLLTTYIGFSQNNPRPTRSRFWNAKESTFSLKAGDILVYHVKNNGEEYDYVVTIDKYDKGVDFSYRLTSKGIKGSVSIPETALNDGATYLTDFAGGNKTTLWLSKTNFRELAAEKQTMMDMGTGIDTFTTKNTSTIKINFKGKEKILTIYHVENESATDKKKFAVLTELNNPLIVTMDAGWTVTLKEVR